MNEEQHIEIIQPENTIRYWCPIDVPALLNTEDNEIAYATKFCGWTQFIPQEVLNEETGEMVTEQVENPITAKQAICARLRQFMAGEYKALFVEGAVEQARQQASAQIEQIL